MSLHQYSIVVHNQYSISRKTYDIGSATVIVLSNCDRQRVTVNIITTHPYKRYSTKVTRRPEINSALANYKKLRNIFFYYYYYYCTNNNNNTTLHNINRVKTIHKNGLLYY